MARISAPVRAAIEAFEVREWRTIAGIDVGENYLDLAITERRHPLGLEFARLDLRQFKTDPVRHLASAIARAAPSAGSRAIVLIDSPANPRRTAAHRGRAIDAALRLAVSAINRSRKGDARIALAMFPTPERDYFVRCAADPRCPPHLVAIARKVLGIEPGASHVGRRQRGRGWLFTRFMLSGFAAFRACEHLGVRAFESYPYLSFAMHKNGGERLPPKSSPREALAERIRIIARLAREAGVRTIPPIARLDQADAAALALSALCGAASRGLYSLSAPREGRFLLAARASDRDALERFLADRDAAGSA
jgi:hypothetical protein